MISLTDKVQVHKFGEDLSNLDLNFDNKIIHSITKEFDKKVEDSGLSIKMGVRGTENYFINNEKFTVTPNNFLIVNKHQQFQCHLKSKEDIEALCLYVSTDIVSEVYSNVSAQKSENLDAPFEKKNTPQPFWERLYDLAEDELGTFLIQARNQLLQPNGSEVLNYTTFYYTLAEKLLDSQLNMNTQVNKIDSAKLSTRKELFSRLTSARSYIFDNFKSNIQLDELSKIALLSKYHLLRTYKKVFEITPYQEVLKLRLDSAKKMMQTDRNIEEIAFEVGFSDRRSFTKAFKKEEGVSPSLYRKIG
ncbi:MAG: AraC family transcriptional regulator [Saprospiraceae bacterium]|jgi:AraC family transcriptional regulator|nr:AraC family transcriptional regulator [Saprospiraceae bacterium]